MVAARAVAAVGLFLVTACTGPSSPPGGGSTAAGGAAASPAPTITDPPAEVVRVQGCEPRSLLPADAPGRCGQQATGALFSLLTRLDPDSGRVRWGMAEPGAVAETIASIDGRRWEVTIKEGWQFHDGSPVTAASFVDAWNAAVAGETAVASAFLFQPILGFDAVHCPEPGCEPTSDRLAGLRVLDERRFEVVLSIPERSFPARLAHPAFAPLPPAAFEDPEGFREAPVGNGPFRLEGPWLHDERISLRPVEGHPALPEEGAPGVDLLLYDDNRAAWDALERGGLDVATRLPPGTWDRAADRYGRVERGGDGYAALVVPSSVPALSEDPRLARALSMAIDREAIIEEHLDGAARPATGLVPPVVSDAVDRCRAICRFDPGWARQLLTAVGGLPEGGIELWVDGDGQHEPWVRAIARQWREHLRLGPQEVRVRRLSHSAWVSHVQDRRAGGMYPIGWRMDVPTAEEYLRELHAPGGLFNLDGFAEAEVGARLAQVGRAPSTADARLLLRRIERDVLASMHHVPLWVRTHRAVHGPRVDGVVLDARGLVRLTSLRLTES